MNLKRGLVSSVLWGLFFHARKLLSAFKRRVFKHTLDKGHFHFLGFFPLGVSHQIIGFRRFLNTLLPLLS